MCTWRPTFTICLWKKPTWHQLKVGTCHLHLQGLYHKLLWLLTFNPPCKAFRVEIRNEALCLLAKTDRTGLQIGTFRRLYKPNSCLFSYLEKHQNLSWWCLLLMTSSKLHKTIAETYAKMCSMYRPLPSLWKSCVYWLHLSPCPFGAVSQRYLKCFLSGQSPHFPPNTI